MIVATFLKNTVGKIGKYQRIGYIRKLHINQCFTQIVHTESIIITGAYGSIHIPKLTGYYGTMSKVVCTNDDNS